MEKSVSIDNFKVETDVSIHNEEDVIGMETGAVCVPQQCEPEEKIDTFRVEGVENVGEEDCIKIKTEDYIQLARTVKCEQENSMETVPSLCNEIYLTVSADGSEVSDRAEVLLTQEEDPLAVASPVVTAADTNGMGYVEGESGSCSEMCVTCDVDGTEEVTIKVEDPIDIMEEVNIKVEEAIDMKDEFPEGTLTEHHHVNSAECRHPYVVQRGKRPYACEVCNRTFTHKSSLITHRNIHSGEHPYTCNVCNKAFSDKCKLITHQHVHNGERPYACDVCNRAFCQKSSLITHQRIHSGEHPYTCDVCNKVFSDKCNLLTHQRIHNGERPYACEVCNRAFSRKNSLIRHRHTHTGERPYACEVCNKAFSRRSNLVTHQRIHSGECPYSCDVCNKAFSDKSNLIKHQHIHNVESPPTCDV